LGENLLSSAKPAAHKDTTGGAYTPRRFRAMSVTVGQLKKSGAKGKELDALVREQLLMIDDKLLRAERTWGRNVVTHELPVGYSLPGLEKKDGQRIIYSSIIRSLAERGFGVRILLESERTFIYLEWVTDINCEEIDAMNRLIRSASIRKEDLPAFLARPDTAAAPPPPARRPPLSQGRA
jgi:hypothetical protein